MDLIANWIEELIQEAQKRGEFDHLPGAGQPLELFDDSGIPASHRNAFRALKNAGFIPREVEVMNRIADLRVQLKDKDLTHEAYQSIAKKLAAKEIEWAVALERLQRKENI